jgi:hypothetical protein
MERGAFLACPGSSAFGAVHQVPKDNLALGQIGCMRQGSAKGTNYRNRRLEVGLDSGGELEGRIDLVIEGLHLEVDGAVAPLLVVLAGADTFVRAETCARPACTAQDLG